MDILNFFEQYYIMISKCENPNLMFFVAQNHSNRNNITIFYCRVSDILKCYIGISQVRNFQCYIITSIENVSNVLSDDTSFKILLLYTSLSG
jgi:hypothetical protein